jgi:GNAT superfamily N-acetyltransferase
MRPWTLTPERADEAARALDRAFPDDDPLAAYLAPDPAVRRTLTAILHARSIASGLAIGRVDAWGDPIVGAAIWLPRPALEAAQAPRRRGPGPLDELGPAVAERVRRFGEVQRRLRAIARPDRHAYLDEIGVTPEHRRQGIATALLEVGHAWADARGLPCALEANTDANVAFYERRGYEVVDSERVAGSDLVLTAMRRRTPVADR